MAEALALISNCHPPACTHFLQSHAPFWSNYHEQVEGMTILLSSHTDLLVATAGSKGVILLWSADYSPTAISGFKCVAEQWVWHGRPKGLHVTWG